MSDLEKNISYEFKNKELLERALTHSSVNSGKFTNNERLEFLGDRVLGLIIADIITRKFKHEDEGKLAKRHTALVRQDALYNIAQVIHLEKFIKLSAGEANSGGKKKKTILSDAMEALIAAIYIDSGFDSAFEFVKKFWEPMIDDQTSPPEDTKSELQEWAQARALPIPVYKLVAKSGSDHSPEFEIEVTVERLGSASAIAESKKSAEKLAAAKLLAKAKKDK